jgi:hypothetical protein
VSATLSPLFTWRTAIAKSGLPPTVRLVAFTLSLYMNERGGSAWPSITTLAEDSGLSPASVKRGTKALERAGYLLCERKEGLSTHYTATAPTQLTFPQEEVTQNRAQSEPGSQGDGGGLTVIPDPAQGEPLSSQELANTTPEGQRPSPPAALNGKGKNGTPFHLADMVNLGLVISLKDRYRRRKPWDGVTEGLLTGLVLGGKKNPAYGARAVNAAIDDLYANADGVSNPAGYLRERAEAHAEAS